MRWPVFLFWNALGGIAWATSVGLLAYFVGPAVEHIVKILGLVGVAVVLLAIGTILGWKRLKRRQQSRSSAD